MRADTVIGKLRANRGLMTLQGPWIRQSQRVIRIVSELHRMGFQKLRIMPFE